MGKAARRARKKANRAKARVTCDYCGFTRPDEDGNHGSVWSESGWTWEGISIVAFCERCGCDTCH
jgi:hypothetical protein